MFGNKQFDEDEMYDLCPWKIRTQSASRRRAWGLWETNNFISRGSAGGEMVLRLEFWSESFWRP